MDMGRFLIETHLRTGRPIKELAAAHEVSASWLFKLLRRYRLEGPAGLEPRSRRPKTSPTRIADLYEDEIVALQRSWPTTGFDAGAATIHFHLAQRHRRGAVGLDHLSGARGPGLRHPPPQKRPKSSLQALRGRPPQRVLAGRHDPRRSSEGGEVYEVLNMIDDHSRLCVASGP